MFESVTRMSRLATPFILAATFAFGANQALASTRFVVQEECDEVPTRYWCYYDMCDRCCIEVGHPLGGECVIGGGGPPGTCFCYG